MFCISGKLISKNRRQDSKGKILGFEKLEEAAKTPE